MRFHDWPDRLAAFIASRENRPLKWGRLANDCGSFVAAAALAIREDGLDLMIGIPEYATAADADMIVGDSYAALMDARLPRRESAGLAQRGDIVLAELRGRETLLVVEGDFLVGPGARKLERVPRSEALICWAV